MGMAALGPHLAKFHTLWDNLGAITLEHWFAMWRAGLIVLALAVFALPFIGTSSDPVVPADRDAAWNLLNLATVTDVVEGDVWKAVKEFPDELRDATSGFTVQGYLVPIVAEAELSRFILIQDSLGCPFCGSSYGPILDVELAKAIPALPEFTEITVVGELDLIDDPDTYQMFVLREARALN